MDKFLSTNHNTSEEGDFTVLIFKTSHQLCLVFPSDLRVAQFRLKYDMQQKMEKFPSTNHYPSEEADFAVLILKKTSHLMLSSSFVSSD